MKAVRKEIPVDVIPIDTDTCLITPKGQEIANAGDYVVIYPNGDKWVVKKENFKEKYEILEDEDEVPKYDPEYEMEGIDFSEVFVKMGYETVDDNCEEFSPDEYRDILTHILNSDDTKEKKLFADTIREYCCLLSDNGVSKLIKKVCEGMKEEESDEEVIQFFYHTFQILWH